MSTTGTLDDETPIGPARWSLQRIGLLTTAGILGAAIVYDWVDRRAGLTVSQFLARKLPRFMGRMDTAGTVQEILWTLLTFVALGLAVRADGARAMGLRARGSRAWQVRVLGLALLVPNLAATIAELIVLVVHYGLTPGDALSVSLNEIIHGVDNLPSWYVDFHSTVAGVGEEILVMALAWRLLEYVPWRPTGRPFVYTAFATLVLIGVRLPYHVQGQGPLLTLRLATIVTFTWATIWLYRTTRMIIPLIAAHAGWDMIAAGWWLATYVIVGIGCVAVTVQPAGARTVFGLAPKKGAGAMSDTRFVWQRSGR
jgi:hypothetical protein